MPDLIGDVPDVGGSPLRVCVDGAVLTLGRPGQPLWRLGTGERDLLLRYLMRGEFAIEAEAGAAAVCPTSCDPDCELSPYGCHERHQLTGKRDHDPDRCEADQPAAQRAALQASRAAGEVP